MNLVTPAPDKNDRDLQGLFGMNNSLLTNADSATHIKVVIVSLLAAIMVVGIGILAKPDLSGSGAVASQMEHSGPVIRAGKATVFASEVPVIR